MGIDNTVYGYVYITTCLVNGKRYIGQKKSSKFLGNKYLGSGKLLSRAVHKYGENEFSVSLIEECISKEELDEKEIYWIKYYDAVNSDGFYNLVSGGHLLGVNGLVMSEESKAKMRKAKLDNLPKQCGSGEDNPMHGRVWINNGSESRPVEESDVQTFLSSGWELGRITDLGKYQYDRHGSRNPFYGKHFSDESKKKLSESHKGKVAITNGEVNRVVNPNELQEFLLSGFTLGRTIKKK
jgi:group I intron endonuclease